MPSTILTSVGRFKETKKEMEEAVESLKYAALRCTDETRKKSLENEARDLQYAIGFGKKAGR